ncbi:HPr family phosphocarrier protein [Clostridium sp. UBA4548]|uniref:HPr family phosphocarrier protein n=1 Tax=Clostridium sp. UBA4548 TaxID=1946361 RepID=UPI0025BDABCA|nr:HPr family phosphocarrier protein [Clostridium sp. UBA4548]
MVSKEMEIKNSQGLHARPATLLVQKATRFKCDIKIEHKGKSANAKSLIGILSLGISKGANITLSTKGSDENAALKEIVELIESFEG